MPEAEQASPSDVLDDRKAAFPEDVIRRATKLVELYDAPDDTDPRQVAAGAVYAVARDRYSSEEIASAFSVENISNMRLRFIDQLGDDYYEYAATPTNVVRDHADELGDEVVEVAERIFDAWDGWTRSSRGVNTLAAAGAYYAKRKGNPEITQEDIGEIFDVTDASLRNAQDDIEDDLTQDELMEAIYGEEVDIDDTPFEGYSQNHSFRDPEKLAEAREHLSDVSAEQDDDRGPTATVGETEDLTPEKSFVVNTTEHGRLYDVSGRPDLDRSKLSANRVLEDPEQDPQSLAFTPDIWATIQETIRQAANGDQPTTKLPPRISIDRAKNGDFVVSEYDEYVRLPPREWVELLAPAADMVSRRQTPRQA